MKDATIVFNLNFYSFQGGAAGENAVIVNGVSSEGAERDIPLTDRRDLLKLAQLTLRAAIEQEGNAE